MARQHPTNLRTSNLVDDADGRTIDLGDLPGGGTGIQTVDASVGDGDSIQDAINNLGTAPQDGGKIDILPAYDPSVETFPVTIDRAIEIQGHGWGDNTKIDLGGLGVGSVFDINVVANPKYPVVFRSLRVDNGAIALDITEVENMFLEHCLFDAQTDHGIDYEAAAFSGWGVYVDTIVDSATNTGWQMGQATPAPNNTVMYGCQARECGGPGVILGGHATDWINGGIEQNDGVGLKFDTGSGGEYLVHGTYFESNALNEAGGVEDAHITVNSGAGNKHKVISGIQVAPGGTQPDESIKVTAGENTIIRDVRGFGNASVLVTSGATDTRIHAGVEVAITDNGTRTFINDVTQEALGGTAPGTPANYYTGCIVEDTDNAGDAYVKLPSSGFAQIST